MALAQVDFFSKALMRTVTANIVVPADKFSFGPTGVPSLSVSDKPFKTLYLLHGIFGNYTDWVTKTRVQQLAEDRDLVVVMPSGDNGFYNDHADGSRYGEFIGTELVEFTRRMFNLSHKRADTFIGGLSMGGYGAIVNALRNPETFGSVVGLSSALTLGPQIEASTDDAPTIMGSRPYYESVFGPIEQIPGSENDYDALAERVAASKGPKPRFYLACGTEDALLPSNQAYATLLKKLGYELEYHEGPGNHTWAFWDEWIEKSFAWLPLDTAHAAVSSGNVQ